MQTLHLTLAERLILPALLPQKGGRVTMRLAQSLLTATEFSPDEISLYELRDEPGGLVRYNPQTAQTLRLTLTVEQILMLRTGVDEADNNERITMEMLSLCEKIDQLTL